MGNDIGKVLSDWPYDPDMDINVRIIDSEDGPKLQMRVDMGIIQMELDGNPCDDRPKGFDSWFDYFQSERTRVEGTVVDDYFTLTDDDCSKLRREAIHYYYRYLCLTKLEDYERVSRDTDRNLRIFAFVKKYAESELNRWALDRYRPYVIMINTRAKSSLAFKIAPETGLKTALELLNNGIHDVMEFYEEYGLSEEKDNSIELSILTALKAEFLDKMPLTLEEQLENSVREERFEDAAIIRDLLRLKNKSN